MKPRATPIGLKLAHTAKEVSRAFEHALSEKGSSLPIWLVLMSLMRSDRPMQSDLARDVGVRGPTLTHHLNAMERDGLISRRREPDNRRVHRVELTQKGRDTFYRLREAAIAHDARLRAGFSEVELDQLRDMLARLAANVNRPARHQK